jgi:hypothetical protein
MTRYDPGTERSTVRPRHGATVFSPNFCFFRIVTDFDNILSAPDKQCCYYKTTDQSVWRLSNLKLCPDCS